MGSFGQFATTDTVNLVEGVTTDAAAIFDLADATVETLQNIGVTAQITDIDGTDPVLTCNLHFLPEGNPDSQQILLSQIRFTNADQLARSNTVDPTISVIGPGSLRLTVEIDTGGAADGTADDVLMRVYYNGNEGIVSSGDWV